MTNHRPLQNRVLPTGEIVAHPARGTMTGNRGILHGPDKVLGRVRWRHKAWICCVLDWQGRRRDVMTGRNWTELFFRDEATAMAAGHRPCAYCRRADYVRFCNAWKTATGSRLKAPQMDDILHKARVKRDHSQIRHRARRSHLPDGVFVQFEGDPGIIWKDAFHPYAPDEYGAAKRIAPNENLTVLTPAPMVSVIAGGYRPIVFGPIVAGT